MTKKELLEKHEEKLNTLFDLYTSRNLFDLPVLDNLIKSLENYFIFNGYDEKILEKMKKLTYEKANIMTDLYWDTNAAKILFNEFEDIVKEEVYGDKNV